MANVVRIATQVTGVGKASSDVDNLRDKFAKLQKQGAKGFAIGVGVAAGAAALNLVGDAAGMAADALGDAARAAMEDEASQSKLSTALHANVKGWDGNTDAIEKVLKARMKLGFSDDEQRDSLAVLVAKTGDATEALNIQRVAMDLARLKGIDLAEATKAISLGMMGQGRALKELGINVKEMTDKTEVLGAIQTKASGQAEAWGDTTAGAANAAQVAMDEASETVGYKLTPLLKDLAIVIRDNVGPAVDGLSTVVGALGNVIDAGIMILDPFAYAMRGAKEEAERLRLEGLAKLADEMRAANPTMHTYSERVDAIAGASREAADAIAEIPPPVIFSRRELAKLAQEFKDTARAARDNRLDEAYDIAELPIKIREARREVKDAQKELEDARSAAQRDAATLRLLEAQRELDNLRNAMADKTEGFAALGHLLGTAYGRALFLAVAAWNRRTSSLPLPNPRYGSGTRNVDRPEGNAEGGRVAANKPVIVGEKGWELFTPDAAGTIIPHDQVTAAGAARLPLAGGGTNIYVTANLSPTGYSPAQAEQIANAVGPAIATYLRRRGLLVN